MAKAVLTTKVDPSYDDLPEERYHFSRTYLNAVRQSLHDWIVYYEPRRVSADVSSSGGRQSYFATARIVGIGEDPQRTSVVGGESALDDLLGVRDRWDRTMSTGPLRMSVR